MKPEFLVYSLNIYEQINYFKSLKNRLTVLYIAS